MTKVTFPHLGNFHIPCKAFLIELGLDPVIPPPTSGRTIALGTNIAPEFACFPLKINLGNHIEALEKGAECILMAGGVGPCRFGYYGEIQREILRDSGYDADFFIFEAPKTHPLQLWENIKRIVPRRTVRRLIKALYIFWLKAQAIDTVDRLANKIRPVEPEKGMTTAFQQMFYRRIDNASLARDIHSVFKSSILELRSMAGKNKDAPLKIMILGEIYMVMEPRVNFQIEKSLGDMGVEVKRTIYLTEWLFEHLGLSLFWPDWFKPLELAAKPYLESSVGGHGLETVAHAVEAGVNRFNGVIELAPFTCMPEIVAMQALPDIARELGIPTLNLIIDEHSAEAGIATRLEAFVDLLKYRNLSRKGHAETAPENPYVTDLAEQPV